MNMHGQMLAGEEEDRDAKIFVELGHGIQGLAPRTSTLTVKVSTAGEAGLVSAMGAADMKMLRWFCR